MSEWLDSAVELNPLGQNCECVEVHVPSAFVPTQHHILPQSWGGQTVYDNLVWLCPNSHTAVHRLLDEYVRAGGNPGWSVSKHFSPYQRALALRAWDQRPENPTITSLAH